MMKEIFNNSYFTAQKSSERKSTTVTFCDFPKTKEKSKEVGGI
ncbi:hypothetical protein [Streptococcus suis]|nr:hypothetical protein [Streptococcus suis]